MHFAWSSSTAAAPSKVSRKTHASSKRPATSQHKRVEKLQAVQNARKKEKVKTGIINPRIKHTSKVEESFFVYVGNLKPSITEKDLRSHFSTCGQIREIIFRCSRGCVTSIRPAKRDPFSLRDRQYATIEFRESKAARSALIHNGKYINGCQIVVTTAAADLPEVQDIIYSRLGTVYEGQGRVNPLKGKARAIPLEKTEAHFDNPPSDRHRVFGFSFAKCVV